MAAPAMASFTGVAPLGRGAEHVDDAAGEGRTGQANHTSDEVPVHAECDSADHHDDRGAGVDAEQPGVGEGVAGDALHDRAREAERGADQHRQTVRGIRSSRTMRWSSRVRSNGRGRRRPFAARCPWHRPRWTARRRPGCRRGRERGPCRATTRLRAGRDAVGARRCWPPPRPARDAHPVTRRWSSQGRTAHARSRRRTACLGGRELRHQLVDEVRDAEHALERQGRADVAAVPTKTS